MSSAVREFDGELREAKSTAAKLWSKETGVTLYTNDRLGAPSNLIVESVLQQGNSTGPVARAKTRSITRLAVDMNQS
jgi:hypothetical protein